MLAQFLALTIAFASFSLYMAAFFFPEVHRKYDLVWSGVGMFYALVLWVCAGRITGGVLLGQTASVALLGWLGWQTLSLRRSLTPLDQQTPLPGSAKTIGEAVQIKLKELQVRGLNLPQPLARLLTQLQDRVGRLFDNRPKPKRSTRPIAYEVPKAVEAELAAELAVAEVSDAIQEALPEAAEVAEVARPAASPPVRTGKTRPNNPFANLRDRVQGKVAAQKQVPKQVAKPKQAASASLVDEFDFDEGSESGELVEMTAELEAVEIEAVEVAEPIAAVEEPMSDQALPTATAVSDDMPVLEQPDSVIAADAVMEEELGWEAGVPVNHSPQSQANQTAELDSDVSVDR